MGDVLLWIGIGSVLLIAGGLYGLSLILGASERATKGDDRLLQELRPGGRYVVKLLSGESLTGVLVQVDDRSVVLREADGDVVLRRESLAYVKRTGA